MTPFKIRDRLKRLLGLESTGRSPDAGPPSPREKVTLILVDGDGNEQTAEGGAGDTLLFISGKMKKPIGTGCNDSGCSTCRVDVLEGAESLARQDRRERGTLARHGHPKTMRLACRAELQKGTVKVRAHEFLEL
ncbi:MAG TPA: 2Fe-2S iron-sulfur cluster-binding protein [Myxococcota bacterium]|nr:2Fe-2S iron-sulfur cluster-binding protein [Myxococcota bacterium]